VTPMMPHMVLDSVCHRARRPLHCVVWDPSEVLAQEGDVRALPGHRGGAGRPARRFEDVAFEPRRRGE